MPAAKASPEKPKSISDRKRRVTLSRRAELSKRLLLMLRPAFEDYVRAHREFEGFDPDTLEVSSTWPEDVVDEG